MHNCIDSINVLDKLPCSDHLPISINLVCNRFDTIRPDKVNYQNINKSVNWSEATSADRTTYSRLTKENLKLINVSPDMLKCSSVNCTDIHHKEKYLNYITILSSVF